MNSRSLTCALAVLILCSLTSGVRADDWPQWRHDGHRSAVTAGKLPEPLQLQWAIKLPKLRPAWPQQTAKGFMTFDVTYKPIVLGKRMFVGSGLNHRLTAYDTETGKDVWRFYAGAPIRFAPVAARGKVYVASDDGCLYCLDAATGALKWKVRGGADHRKILGNGHLVSLWPARGGPALADGKIYFGASIWPIVGSFLYCVDAESGKILWCNSGSGARWQASNSYPQGGGRLVRPGMFGTVAQGYIVVAGNRLGIPQGRNVVQLFDRDTGKLMWHEMFGMHVRHDATDHWFATTAGGGVFSGRFGTRGVSIKTGTNYYPNPVGHAITDAKTIYKVAGGAVSTRNNAPGFRPAWNFALSTPAATRGPGSYIKAGDNLYAPGAGNKLLTIKNVDTDKRALLVGAKIPGDQIREMLAADGKLFAVALDGTISCFSAKAGNAAPMAARPAKLMSPANAVPALQVKSILKASGASDGYCLVLGLKDGAMAREVLMQTKMNVIAVGKNVKVVDDLRREVDAAGLYGARFSAHVGDPLDFGLPPYMANLILSETLTASDKTVGGLFNHLRPYSGAIVLPRGQATAKPRTATTETTIVGSWRVVRRLRPPEGTAQWSHNNGNAANTLTAFDKLVKPPLGMLWFGGPTNDPILPRHARGPTPAVLNGRLVIEGRNILRCTDIYTGRLFWEAKVPDIGKFYDHGGKQMGTHETGPNYSCGDAGVLVITPATCHLLDWKTGKQIREFPLPKGVEAGSLWATVRVEGGVVVATIRPIDTKRGYKENARTGAGGRWLAAYDVKTGKALWARKAVFGWRSNGVALAGGKTYCIDGLAKSEIDAARKRGIDVSKKAALFALDTKTGKESWKIDDDVFGTWLAYSAEHDLLVMAGAGGNDPRILAVHKGADGSRVWRQPAVGQDKPSFYGPPIVHHEIILSQSGPVIGLKDGKLQTWLDPLTGKDTPWFFRAHGCGFALAGEYFATLRAWSTGGYQLFKGVPHLIGIGGLRSGCTANMVPAGGVLATPDYTRDCTCQFKSKTSIGMIHMPDTENWAIHLEAGSPKTQIKRIGLNFGAPGDRQDDKGTLWLNCPTYLRPGSHVNVTFTPATTARERNWAGNWRGVGNMPAFGGDEFHHHSTIMKGGPLPWVGGSGWDGVKTVTVPIQAGEAGASYTVNLYFAEPHLAAKPGDRVFSVKVQGKPVIAGLDVVKEAGGPRRTIIKTVKGVKVGKTLTVEFSAAKGKALICGLEAIAD